VAVADWTTDPYPVARSKRGVASSTPGPSADTEPTLAPRVRFWSQRIKMAANQVGRVTSPRFRGPALLKDLTGSCVSGQSNVPIEILAQLFIGNATLADTIVAGQVLSTPGENIVDTSFIDSTVATAYTRLTGFVWRLDGTAAQMFTQPLDYVVYSAEFWVTLQLRNPATVNGMTIDSTMRIYEDCDPDSLVLLMG